VDANRTYFDAEVQALDFAVAPRALGVMNGWASEHTQGRIERVLDELRPDDVMFLMNALYFKGAWRARFDPALTAPAPFTRDDGGQATVPMMRRAGVTVRAGYADGAQAVELPYGNGAFAMTIVLPPPGTAVDAWVAALTPARWDALLGALHDETLDVYLPRFAIEYEDEWNDVLTALGMGVAFDPARADFTRIAASGGLYVSLVKQNTFVAVDEEGTEAAAVTVVGIRETSAPPSFRADRPFVFAVRERLSGTLLFVGKVAAP
jgi:serpin B